MPYSQLKANRRFGGTYSVRVPGRKLFNHGTNANVDGKQSIYGLQSVTFRMTDVFKITPNAWEYN
jgi:hypothetical protein